MSEWDGTEWAGSAVAVAERMGARREPHPDSAVIEGKATFGPGIYYAGNPMLSSIQRSPQKIMREAQALYWSNPWIRTAEKTVTRQVSGLPWHLEDEQDDEVDDQTGNPALKAIQTLLEKPQAALDPQMRQSGVQTWRNLVSLTSRHAGLCGLSYWFPDQPDNNGTPLAILYVNPARVWPQSNANGNLIGYVLDAKDDQGHGGVPLRTDELLPFFLEEPDWGHIPLGLAEVAALKARISVLADQHSAYVLGSGGRIAGIVSPREGYISDDDQFNTLVREFRNANEAPDAAKRTTILRGPIDFQKTAADPSELGLLDINKLTRDDLLAIWGVPASQAGVGGQTVGLNSGETRRYEQQILMQGPVHDRVRMVAETIQYGLLDRWQATGLQPELVIEEPTFDDNAAPYEIASKASTQPLTNNERRDLMGLDPLPPYGPDGKPLGLAIIMPTLYSAWGQGPEDGAPDTNPFPKAPKPKPEPVVNPIPPTPLIGSGIPPVKASFLNLRDSLDERIVPAMKRVLRTFLGEQASGIASRIRSGGERHLKDEAYWFGTGWDKKLAAALKPHVSGIARTVTTRAKEALPAKADPFEEAVEQELLTRTGTRITGINQTTRDAVSAAIRTGIEEGLTAQAIADSIEGLPAFDDARAELVARTETGFAYNTAAVASYREYGVEKVEVIDGDADDICAQANGSVWTLDEANGAPLGHPNCTRDFAPYLGGPS